MANNIENWRLIDGYDNYEVSSHGRIRNNITGIILTQRIDNRYKRISLNRNGKKKYSVHRLVCFAFCPNPNNYDIVDHIDRNPMNNMFNNLRWVTKSINDRNRTCNNETGYNGISREKDIYRVSWNDNNLMRHRKSFSINKLGEQEAKRQAIEWRKQKEIEFGYL